MTRIVTAAITIALFAGLATTAQAAVKSGDLAPEILNLEWVKGSPVDLAKDHGKKLHLIEFWATWCPPCKVSVPLLTELQNTFQDDLVVVGISPPDDRGNTLSAVKRFVREKGETMEYTVAFDTDGGNDEAYMAGKMGIPYCFLVGKDRKIIWEGSPLDPMLKDVVGRVIKGTWDPEKYRKLVGKLNSIGMFAQRGEWEKVRDVLREALTIDPTSRIAVNNLFAVYLTELKDKDGLRAWAVEHINKNKTNAEALRVLAETLCVTNDLTAKYPDLAFEAARTAYELEGSKPSSDTSATYAVALYQMGAVDKAIEIQGGAVKRARPGERERLQLVLEYYKLCKSLQGKLEKS